MLRTKKVVEAECNELIRQSEAIMKKRDAINGNESLENLNKKTLLLNQILRLEQEIFRLGIEYAAAVAGNEEADSSEQEAVKDFGLAIKNHLVDTGRTQAYLLKKLV